MSASVVSIIGMRFAHYHTLQSCVKPTVMRKASFLILAVLSLAMANCSGDEVSAPTSGESNEPSAKPGSKDARGKQLPAWLSTQEGELAIVVDDVGAEYPVEIDPLVATEIELFTANNGVGADAFGVSVSVSGDTALVGAMYDDVGSNVDQGAAYVFVRSGGSWVQQARLVAGDGKAGDWAGRCVSLSGDTAIVGADYHTSTGNVGQGAAYIFVRNGTTWTQQQKLEVNEGGALAQFGFSVAIDGNTAIVGARAANMGPNVAQGAAYVFVRDSSVWQLQKRLLADDGGQVDRFGVSVDVQGDTAIVGANQDDLGGHTDQGSAYIFTRTGSTWGQQAHLAANDGSAGDTFGCSVKLSGDTAIVGSRYHNIGGQADQGAAYVFTRNINTWSQQTKLTADDGAAADGFGVFVTIAGDVALVGAAEDNVGLNADQGSVYVFERQGSTWQQQTHKWANGGVAGDWFGFWCALSDDTFIVGAPYDTAPGAAKQGTVYAYRLEANLGDTCVMSNECLSGFCVDGFCCDTACSDTCQACTAVKKGQGIDGVCGPIALDGDPDNECPVGSCSGSGTCQSFNGVACSSPATCLSGYCADGVCCGNACEGPCRACTVATRGGGYDGQCGPIAAGTDPEDECPSAECNGAGACQLPRELALGAACSENTQCVSGFCADGVCCNSACPGMCEACSSAKKTYGSDGECEPIAATKNPDGECSGGYCNGSGACVYFNGVACASASECISTYCVDDVCCGNACTDSCMACTIAKRGGGYDGQCGFIATYTDPDDECPSAECNGSGACQLSQGLALGAACIENTQCASGFCADGVCCNSACTESCVACNQPAAIGMCSNVDSGQSDPSGTPPCNDVCDGTGQCVLGTGAACTSGNQCLSRICNKLVCDAPKPANGPLQWMTIHTDQNTLDQVAAYNDGTGVAVTGSGALLGSFTADGVPDLHMYGAPINPAALPDIHLARGGVMTAYQKYYQVCTWYPYYHCYYQCGVSIPAGLGNNAAKYLIGKNDAGQVGAIVPGNNYTACDPVPYGSIGPGDMLMRASSTGTTELNLPLPAGTQLPIVLGPVGEFYWGSGVELTRTDVNASTSWTKSATVSGAVTSSQWDVDAAGNILIALSFSGSIDYGAGPMTATGPRDLGLVKLDPAGNVVWQKHFGSSAFTMGNILGLSRTGTGDMTVWGDHTGPIDLGTGTLQGATLVVKFDASGNALWHIDLVVADHLRVSGDLSGAVYLGGSEYYTVDFGWGAVYGFFVAKFN
jgi:FG-GAP repeat